MIKRGVLKPLVNPAEKPRPLWSDARQGAGARMG
jgi:hypothetical protein